METESRRHGRYWGKQKTDYNRPLFKILISFIFPPAYIIILHLCLPAAVFTPEVSPSSVKWYRGLIFMVRNCTS